MGELIIPLQCSIPLENFWVLVSIKPTQTLFQSKPPYGNSTSYWQWPPQEDNVTPQKLFSKTRSPNPPHPNFIGHARVHPIHGCPSLQPTRLKFGSYGGILKPARHLKLSPMFLWQFLSPVLLGGRMSSGCVGAMKGVLDLQRFLSGWFVSSSFHRNARIKGLAAEYCTVAR